jgi:hypothetical protein
MMYRGRIVTNMDLADYLEACQETRPSRRSADETPAADDLVDDQPPTWCNPRGTFHTEPTLGPIWHALTLSGRGEFSSGRSGLPGNRDEVIR